MNGDLDAAIEFIRDVITEKTTSKGVREKLKQIIDMFDSGEIDKRIVISRAIEKLEEFELDPNIDGLTRQNIYNIVAFLGQCEE